MFVSLSLIAILHDAPFLELGLVTTHECMVSQGLMLSQQITFLIAKLSLLTGEISLVLVTEFGLRGLVARDDHVGSQDRWAAPSRESRATSPLYNCALKYNLSRRTGEEELYLTFSRHFNMVQSFKISIYANLAVTMTTRLSSAPEPQGHALPRRFSLRS